MASNVAIGRTFGIDCLSAVARASFVWSRAYVMVDGSFVWICVFVY